MSSFGAFRRPSFMCANLRAYGVRRQICTRRRSRLPVTLDLSKTCERVTRTKRVTNGPPYLHWITTSSLYKHPDNTTHLEAPQELNDAERAIFQKLNTSLEPIALEVQDISGGCGSMYGLDIVSEKFRGLSVVKQHKLVNEVLKEEVSGWHGVTLKTRVP